MWLPAIPLFVAFLLGGCAASKPFDANALNGKPYAEVVRSNRLNTYHSWPEMNTPAFEDAGVTYFLETGNLTFKYSSDHDGKPAVVHNAEFWPSEKSAEQRFQQANTAWDEYVAAHGGYKPTK
ncbi:MAG TPA: hypothetical protein VFC46_01795 [Humisphaera sp.]|nr:hypothetical protein [Humisphaera sp.]